MNIVNKLKLFYELTGNLGFIALMIDIESDYDKCCHNRFDCRCKVCTHCEVINNKTKGGL